VSAEDDQGTGCPVRGQQLRADLMIAEFAKAGILCTPLNPRHIEESYIDAVIAKADVIILDWEINLPGLPGDQPAENYCLTIMKKLKAQDRFRLVIIYTGAGAEDIESEINKICPMTSSTNLVWEIWGKPDSFHRKKTINYEELPLRIIQKFAAENPVFFRLPCCGPLREFGRLLSGCLIPLPKIWTRPCCITGCLFPIPKMQRSFAGTSLPMNF
jgi:hypothetical protein